MSTMRPKISAHLLEFNSTLTKKNSTEISEQLADGALTVCGMPSVSLDSWEAHVLLPSYQVGNQSTYCLRAFCRDTHSV